jgi:beta-mannosidase
VANNSLVNWPARPKPAYAAAASACRPVALCARMAKFSWRNGERFAAELWLLNDSPRPVPAARVRATLRIGGGTTIEVAFWPCPGAAAGENTEGPAPVLILPDVAGAEELILEVEAEGRPEWTQRYRLHYRGGVPAPLHGVAARLALNANSDPEGRVPG